MSSDKVEDKTCKNVFCSYPDELFSQERKFLYLMKESKWVYVWWLFYLLVFFFVRQWSQQQNKSRPIKTLWKMPENGCQQSPFSKLMASLLKYFFYFIEHIFMTMFPLYTVSIVYSFSTCASAYFCFLTSICLFLILLYYYYLFNVWIICKFALPSERNKKKTE